MLPPSISYQRWCSQLEDATVIHALQPRTSTLFLDIYVDASTSWGVGLLWGRKWVAWQAVDGWKGPCHDIGWLEGVAVELTIYALVEHGLHDCCVRVYSDNDRVIGAFDKGRSRNFKVNLSICRVSILMASRNITLDLEYIETSKNPADLVSRGILGCENDRLPLDIKLPKELWGFFHHV